jgi:hypothetical protein
MKSENSALARALQNMASGLLYLSHQKGFGQTPLNHSDKRSDKYWAVLVRRIVMVPNTTRPSTDRHFAVYETSSWASVGPGRSHRHHDLIG